jgi:hypothetical protein
MGGMLVVHGAKGNRTSLPMPPTDDGGTASLGP